MRRITLGVLTVILLILVSASVAKDFPGVKGLMSAEEFAGAGLNKLSVEELKALDQWLLRYTKDDVPELVKEVPELKESIELKAAVAPEPKPEPKVIQSRIKGGFKGWAGKTIFELENGQIWKQRQSGKYRSKLDSPEVRISKNFMGFYVMEIVKTGRQIGVKRVR